MRPQLHPIELTATTNNWRLFMLRKADFAFLTFQEKIHRRDHDTCQFCGFEAKAFLETINLDGNYLRNKASNLATACGFCAQCFFLEAIGRSNFGGGVLIYLPELSQAELNALCHVLFASMVFRLSHEAQAKNIYRSLKLRAQLVEEKVGEGLSNPALFGQVLIDSQVEKADNFRQVMSQSFRLLPNMSRYATEILGWSKLGVRHLQGKM